MCLDDTPYSTDPLTHSTCRGFKALKQLVKVLYKLERFEDMTKRYAQLLEHTKSKEIVRNDTEKAINKVLSLVKTGGKDELLEKIYELTLDYLRENKNEVHTALPPPLPLATHLHGYSACGSPPR